MGVAAAGSRRSVAFTIGMKDGLPDSHRGLLSASLSLFGPRRCATGLLNASLSIQMLSDGQILRHADSTPSPPAANWAKPPHGRANELFGRDSCGERRPSPST